MVGHTLWKNQQIVRWVGQRLGDQLELVLCLQVKCCVKTGGCEASQSGGKFSVWGAGPQVWVLTPDYHAKPSVFSLS